MGYALEVSELGKKIKRKQILNDINITIGYGETLGLIGANGAGKTSVIKCVTRLWHKDKGSIKICGHDLSRNFVSCMKECAAIVEYPKLFPNLTLLQNINYFSSFYKNKDTEYTKKLLNLLGLDEAKARNIKTYSSGMQQKACLLIVLLRRPKMLLLDEPTSMLDPKSAAEIRQFLMVLKNNGVSMLISSHNLHEVEKLCDKVFVIDEGKEKSIIDLKQGVKKRRYIIEYENNEAAAQIYRVSKSKYHPTLYNNKLYIIAEALQLREFLSEYGDRITDLYADDKLEKEFLSALTGVPEYDF